MSNWNPNAPQGGPPPTGWPSNPDNQPSNASAPHQGMQPYGAPVYPPQGYPQPGYPPQGYPQPMMQPMIINVMGGSASSSSSSSSAAAITVAAAKTKTSHLLHLIATIFTGGLWLPVWLTLYAIRGCN